MRISTRSRYGLRAVVELAIEGRPMLLKEISGRLKVSMKYLDHIFSSLKRAGIIRSIKSHSGYVLSKRPSKIKAIDVIKALEGLSFVDCIESPQICNRAGSCATQVLWKRLKGVVEKILDISIKELADIQRKLNVRSKNMYYI